MFNAVYVIAFIGLGMMFVLAIAASVRLYRDLKIQNIKDEMPHQSTTKQCSDNFEEFFTQHGFSYVVSLQKESTARPWGADIYRSNYLSVAHMHQAFEGSWFLVAPYQAPIEAFTATGPGFPWKNISFAWEDYSQPFAQLAKQYEYPEEPPAEAWTALEKRQLSIYFELVMTARIQI